MKHTKEEIIDALKVVKETCVEFNIEKDTCVGCPFNSHRSCCIVDSEPSDWDFNDNEPIWHAFK